MKTIATTQMPTATSIGSWIEATSTGVAAASRPSDAAAASDRDQRARRESEQGDIEHDRLELAGSLRDDHRHDDRDGDRGERHIGGESPQDAGGDRYRHKGKVACRRRLGDCRNEGEREREEREDPAKVVSLEPTSNGPSSHTPTVLLGSRRGLLLPVELRTPM